jgi:hypothetical protein
MPNELDASVCCPFFTRHGKTNVTWLPRRDFVRRRCDVAVFGRKLAGQPSKVDRLVLKAMPVRRQAQELLLSGKTEAAEPQLPTR